MYPPAPSHSDPGAPQSRLPWATIAAIAVLTIGAVALGQRDRAVPERVLRDWQVADVPPSLTALLLVVAAAGLLVGAWAVLRDADLRPGDPVFVVWSVVSLLASAALIWDGLFMAANAEFETGAMIPVFHWMFTFVPALLTGLAARGRGAARAIAAALSTGVVTVPLFGLGWSLLSSRESLTDGIGSSLWLTAIFGLVPLGVAAAISRSSALSTAWKREHPAP